VAVYAPRPFSVPQGGTFGQHQHAALGRLRALPLGGQRSVQAGACTWSGGVRPGGLRGEARLRAGLV
jgi:hypothetical protein